MSAAIAATAAIATLTAVPAQALQVVEATDGVTVEAIVSIKEPTRIRIDGAPITTCSATSTRATAAQRRLDAAGHRQHTPYASDQSGRRDRAGVRPRQGRDLRPPGRRPPGKPVNLFISSQHATYTLLLRRSDTPADTIVIRDRTPRAGTGRASHSGPAPEPDRQSNHIRALKAMLVAMASDRVPTDVRVEETNRSDPAVGRSALRADPRQYEGSRPDRRAYLLQNVSKNMVLAEQEFDRPEQGGRPVLVSVEQPQPAPRREHQRLRDPRGGSDDAPQRCPSTGTAWRRSNGCRPSSASTRCWRHPAGRRRHAVADLRVHGQRGEGQDRQVVRRHPGTVTNIGVMPPGQQVNPVDQWVGTAGSKLGAVRERARGTGSAQQGPAGVRGAHDAALLGPRAASDLRGAGRAGTGLARAATASAVALPPAASLPLPPPPTTSSLAAGRPLSPSAAMPPGQPNMPMASSMPMPAAPVLSRVTLVDRSVPPAAPNGSQVSLPVRRPNRARSPPSCPSASPAARCSAAWMRRPAASRSRTRTRC
jgi:conjugal transfer pilus assembly protein TraK